MKHRAQWNKLDNAANIFTPTSGLMDPKVFRCSCELYEDIDPVVLQRALEETLTQLPYFQSIIKKGFFWYYLERCDMKPAIAIEQKYPCSPIYDPDRYGLLFEVTYYQKRISLEVFHAVTDGAGGFQFLRLLVVNYITRKYPQDFQGKNPMLELHVVDSHLTQDGFLKNYSKTPVRREKNPTAYQLKGDRFPNYHLGVVECVIPLGSALQLAKEQGVSLTALMSAMLMQAIHKDMSVSEEKRPVVISVPVNLRNFFPTASVRNFFSVFLVSHDFSSQGQDFTDIVSNMKQQFQMQLTAQAIGEKMNVYASLENKLAAKLTPLALKSPGLKIGNTVFDRSFTAGVSNLGAITMPEGFSRYIRLFDVLSSTKKLDLCLCSYEDLLVLSFTSSLLLQDIQKNFVRALAEAGITVTVDTNLHKLGPG